MRTIDYLEGLVAQALLPVRCVYAQGIQHQRDPLRLHDAFPFDLEATKEAREENEPDESN
jgi:hypothetical protein